jgi:hypothetical protein
MKMRGTNNNTFKPHRSNNSNIIKNFFESHKLNNSNIIKTKCHKLHKLRVMSEPPTMSYTPTRNARASHLLEMPAELRDQIWIHAFGGRAVHIRVRNPNPRQNGKRWCISYDACKEALMDDEVNRLDHMKGTTRWNEAIAQTHSTGDFIGSHRFCTKNSIITHTIVPLICKQLYHEAMPIAWKHSTITFDNGWDLAHLSRIPLVRFDLISQLSIHITDNELFIRWRNGLNNTNLLSRFKSLQGLNLVQMYTGSGPVDLNEDLCEMPYHSVGLMRIIVEAFQRFALRGERTTVSVYRGIFSLPGPVQSLPGLAEQARNDLLNLTSGEGCARDKTCNVG